MPTVTRCIRCDILEQEELESINETLGTNCRRLKILYLQNNIIGEIRHLHHMKDLEYLNLALNNIKKVSFRMHALARAKKRHHPAKLIPMTGNVASVVSVRNLSEAVPSCPKLNKQGDAIRNTVPPISGTVASLKPRRIPPIQLLAFN